MISFWYRLSEHDGSRAHLLVNPPDIGLTEPASNFSGSIRSGVPSAT
jgi:hypothetical protein